MTSLFLLLCLSLLLRLPWYTVDFTLHSAMITQFTSYFSPLGIITLATCPFRDKKQTRLVYFHHTYTQHTVFDFMPYPLRISKQHRNPHVMVKERISRPKRSPDSWSIFYSKIEVRCTQSKHPVTCMKKWTINLETGRGGWVGKQRGRGLIIGIATLH